MNTPDGITQKLIGNADRKLRKEIEEAASLLFKFLNDGSPHRFYTTATISKEKVEVYFRESFSAIKELAFSINQQRCQEAEINNFLSKVESLETQLDDIRQSIPN